MDPGNATHKNIAGAATTVVSTNPGRLYRIVINKAVANGVVTVYDNTAGSGTIIATITQPAAVVQSQCTLDFGGARLNTGLTVVTSAADDITVVYS